MANANMYKWHGKSKFDFEKKNKLEQFEIVILKKKSKK